MSTVLEMPDTPETLRPATYDLNDIARLASCSRKHAERLADKGCIPGRIGGLGKLVRFAREAVDRWLAGEK